MQSPIQQQYRIRGKNQAGPSNTITLLYGGWKTLKDDRVRDIVTFEEVKAAEQKDALRT